MEKFALLFIGGLVPENLREQNDLDWGDWIASLGASGALVDGGAPFGPDSKVIVSKDQVHDYDWRKDSNVGGFTIVQAEDVDAVVKMAMSCPQLLEKYGSGTIEVRQMAVMM